MTVASTDFEAVYRETVDELHRYIFRFVQDADLAENLTQETFIKAFRAWDGFRGDVPERIWLLRIARNVCIDHLRSPRAAARRATSLDDLEAKGFEPDTERAALSGTEPPPSVEQSVTQGEMTACVQDFVRSLPETLRTPLILHDVEGLTNADIEEVLDCSVAAAKMRLHRARIQLRELMDDDCDLFGDERNVLACLPAAPQTPTAVPQPR